MIPVIHTADIHYNRTDREQVIGSLQTLYATGKEKGVKLWVLAGDLFDRAIYNTLSSGLPELIEIVQKLLSVAPVVTVYGTPTHDIKGSYDVFTRLSAPHNFTVLQPGQPYFLSGNVGEDPQGASLLLLGCPEPGKEWFLASGGIRAAESDNLIVEELKKLFFGMAALRQKHAGLPCVFVYHGNVVGASFQNGREVESGGGIAIGRDDLAMIGADYYALGHVHNFQQIRGLPAYYAGSSYPIDWGERDQKGFYYLEIEKSGGEAKRHRVNVTRMKYPHPPRKKISVELGEKPRERIAGFQVWLELRGSRAELAHVDTEAELEKLLEAGALPGSIVKTRPIHEETIRAGRILKAKTLREKLQVRAENSGAKMAESVLKKADLLEAEGRKRGMGASGYHILLTKLVLRGAKGVWEGQRLDEVEMDFNHFDRGLIALIGANGAGKTTLIENMHPFPCLMTRAGKLQDHFRLKDSFRDLYFTDTRTGTEYRALIRIDGKSSNGKVEYYLYAKNGGQFVPLTNGRKEDYVERVEKIFGSLFLYLKTAFISQKSTRSNPDLGEATVGQRKTIFRELVGLDYLQAYAEEAKARADSLEKKIIELGGKIEGQQRAVDQLPQTELKLASAVKRYDEEGRELKRLEDAGRAAATDARSLWEKLEAARGVNSRLLELDSQHKELNREKTELKARVREFRRIFSRRGNIENEIIEYNKLKEREKSLLEGQRKTTSETARRNEEYLKAKIAVDREKAGYEERIHKLKLEVTAGGGEKGKLRTRTAYIMEQLNEKLECPECHHLFCRDEAALNEDLEKVNAQIREIEKEIGKKNAGILRLQKKADNLIYPQEPVAATFDDTELNELRESMEFIGIERLRSLQTKASEAGIRIQEAGARLKEVNIKLVVVLAEMKELGERVDRTAEAEYEKAAGRLGDCRQAYKRQRDLVHELKAEKIVLLKQIEEMKKWRTEIGTFVEEKATKEAEMSEWRYLAGACGPDGIQALELDALAPNIAEKANTLLEAAYDSRFQIEFRTTRIGGRGSDTRQIEDFLIIVHDSRKEGEQEISTLSGGEEVWIKRAINDAFALVRAENTGLKFLTVFQDETDGALDADAKVAYYRMLEAAHKQSGRHHTIIITHSPLMQEMISQKIFMSDIGHHAGEEAA